MVASFPPLLAKKSRSIYHEQPLLNTLPAHERNSLQLPWSHFTEKENRPQGQSQDLNPGYWAAVALSSSKLGHKCQGHTQIPPTPPCLEVFCFVFCCSRWESHFINLDVQRRKLHFSTPEFDFSFEPPSHQGAETESYSAQDFLLRSGVVSTFEWPGQGPRDPSLGVSLMSAFGCK